MGIEGEQSPTRPPFGKLRALAGERPKGTFLFDGKGRGDTFRRDADRA